MSTEQPDLTRLPRGQREWDSFIQAVSRVDDRAERYFLELKSDLNLNLKEHQAKVAKFILGAANRSPDRAARRFEGYALLVLGVARDQVTGIAPFEAKDLESAVMRYIGAGGPSWDFERIYVTNERDVIVVMVNPPLGETVWTCLRDGPENLRDGGIYIRADGETREAKGGEIREILDRVQQRGPAVDLAVSVQGSVDSVVFSEDPFLEYGDRVASGLRAAARSRDSPSASMLGARFAPAYTSPFHEPETRTREEYEAEIQDWTDRLSNEQSTVIDRIAGAYFPPNAVTIENRSKRFLEDVEVRVHLDGNVRAVEILPKDAYLLEELPEPPRKWGPRQRDSLLPAMANFRSHAPMGSFPTNGVVSYRNGGSVDLTFNLNSLRPKELFVSDDDEFLLIVEGRTDVPVRGRWSVTARGINELYEGELQVPILGTRDLTGALEHLLNPDDESQE